ncbi:hypothetical protein IB229_02270 [Pseudomonas sp. PDM14]|uniref:hypothetical protein n=1 Tax=Pseudomonas sp. PDM14 TaxID=2769288 RepID=UPI0017846144|nr:hypothetical protein [Pseudomonas sp. PDM14]MBD9481780.1 hypothetical protein [Pseudomonas sp. PDM14]
MVVGLSAEAGKEAMVAAARRGGDTLPGRLLHHLVKNALRMAGVHGWWRGAVREICRSRPACQVPSGGGRLVADGRAGEIEASESAASGLQQAPHASHPYNNNEEAQ